MIEESLQSIQATTHSYSHSRQQGKAVASRTKLEDKENERMNVSVPCMRKETIEIPHNTKRREQQIRE